MATDPPSDRSENVTPPPTPGGDGLLDRTTEAVAGVLNDAAAGVGSLIGGVAGLAEGVAGRVVRSVDELGESTLRLGVTGLARSGKTVFTTALVDHLLRPDRLRGLSAVAEGRYAAAVLRPQPDDDTPRFDFEAHRDAIAAGQWPQPTRRLSQLRVSIRYAPRSFWARRLGDTRTLNLDIVDYPGEWLSDLGLMALDYAAWCRAVWPLLDTGAAGTEAWRSLTRASDPAGPQDEALARRLADGFGAWILAASPDDWAVRRIAPGRFHDPGDLAGSPLLTFAPLRPDAGEPARDSLWRLMERRFDSYKRYVHSHFFKAQFARLDRQIVLVDLPGLVAQGGEGLGAFTALLDDVLKCFRYGRAPWPWSLLGRRIDRVVFAATKADLVPSDQHDRMTGFLDALLFAGMNRARFDRAAVRTVALAALRTTTEQTVRRDGAAHLCLRGRPEGEAGDVLHHPGSFPASPDHLGDAAQFRPLAFAPPAVPGGGRALPHARLDHALEQLIGDALT
ncbi:MAG: YcjX family protein [Rhodospirillaceae bacterium]|nr:YcjX family protein [Rhodospirillaceae bacterium]